MFLNSNFKNNKKLSSNLGYTLMELLVSISIIGLISTVIIADYGKGRDSNDLHIATQKIASDLRRTVNYGLGLKDFNGSIVKPGWGVYFDTSNDYYVIFADNTPLPDGNKKYNAPGELFENIKLPVGLELSAISIDAVVQTKLYIVFEPPDPTIHISHDGVTDQGVAVITLKSKQSGKTKTITMNDFGLVDID